MQITDSYSKLLASKSMRDAHPTFRAWNYTDSELARWFEDRDQLAMRETAALYLSCVHSLVSQIEKTFNCSLPGELALIPSMGEVDGFARFDRGHHTVMLGVDFPEASIDYLTALTAHELSHVYRDHCPRVWGFLGKPLHELSREEYLEATTAREHLVSEGLATLTSLTLFPKVPLHEHHYYAHDELKWCQENEEQIDRALVKCLDSSDPDPWKFYGSDVVGSGSPSRTHYYWAAKKLDTWIRATPEMTLLKAHTLPADEIRAF